jgi:hypothetical protein
VTAATVNDQGTETYLGITDQNGVGQILRKPMSEQELADYRAHPDAYFGRVQPVQKEVTDRYELFEWFMECHKGLSRQTLLERLAAAPNFDALESLDDGELLAAYCEGWVAATEAAGFRTTSAGRTRA